MKKYFSLGLLTLSLAACSSSNDSHRSTVASDQGLKCFKSTGPTEQVSYIGIIDIADVPHVAIRSEKTMDFDGQRVSGGLTVQHSDGVDLTMYIMLNVNEKAGIR